MNIDSLLSCLSISSSFSAFVSVSRRSRHCALCFIIVTGATVASRGHTIGSGVSSHTSVSLRDDRPLSGEAVCGVSQTAAGRALAPAYYVVPASERLLIPTLRQLRLLGVNLCAVFSPFTAPAQTGKDNTVQYDVPVNRRYNHTYRTPTTHRPRVLVAYSYGR